MNLFARSLGGWASDAAFRRWGLRGRVLVQFLALLFEGVALLLFSFMDRFWWSLASLVLFALGAEMACGSTYGIVPFINPQHLGPMSALVAAGGNLGAILGTQIYVSYSGSDLLVPFRWHAVVVLVLAVPTLVLLPKTARVNPSTLLT
jgi:NNP family nitrate/nitrite transporter-like MFS transporter